jgi:hypothetical protein
MGSVARLCARKMTEQRSHVTRHTSHVTRHTSHVTRHTSHVTRHTCCVRKAPAASSCRRRFRPLHRKRAPRTEHARPRLRASSGGENDKIAINATRFESSCCMRNILFSKELRIRLIGTKYKPAAPISDIGNSTVPAPLHGAREKEVRSQESSNTCAGRRTCICRRARVRAPWQKQSRPPARNAPPSAATPRCGRTPRQWPTAGRPSEVSTTSASRAGSGRRRRSRSCSGVRGVTGV